MKLTGIEAAAQALDSMRLDSKVDFAAYMAARDEDKALVKSVTDYRTELRDAFYGDKKMLGHELPWAKVRDVWRIRRREVTAWVGFNGHGKSMALNYVALALMDQGEKVCVLSFEMPVYRTLERMARQAIGTHKPTEQYLDRFIDQYDGKLVMYDQTGDVTPERVVAVITYAAEQLGCTQFIVDSIMRVISDEDDMNGQKRFVGKMCQLSKDLNIHVHVVHHSRKKEDERTRPGKQDAKGSGAIVDQLDNFAVVFKLPPDAKPRPGEDAKNLPTHVIYLDKHRAGEWEGHVSLWLDKPSLQFRESAREPVKYWVK